MRTEPTTAQKLRRLPWMYLFQGLNMAFCQLTMFGPSVFVLFLAAAGLDKKQTGLILSMFPLCCIPAVLIGPIVARIGVKRVYIIFYLGRKLVTALLLLTPWIYYRFGSGGAFLYIAGVVMAFSICRAISETAYQTWNAELIPNSIRGRYAAVANVICMLTTMAVVLFASWMLSGDEDQGLKPFIVLIGIGVVFGLLSVAASSTLPGGAPIVQTRTKAGTGGILVPLRDRQFRLYLCGMGLFMLSQPLVAFMPLFMKDHVGLPDDKVMLLDVAAQAAMVLVALPWGWASDRYGSKPVGLTGLFLLLGYPILLLLIPDNDPRFSLPFAMIAVFLYAAVNLGWAIGINSLFYNNLVPREHRTAYTSLHFTWSGVMSGISPLLGGWLLDLFGSEPVRILGVSIDGYGVLMILFVACNLGAGVLLSRIRPPEDEIPTLSFATMFFRGDPIGAVGALFSYNSIGGEQHRMSAIERLGKTRSPLNVNELIESLADPSFNVRYEAIVSIARTRPHPKLTDALIDVLNSSEPDLAMAAAWSLGRIGDPRAIPPLREKLTAGYPLLAARCARALAMLGDTGSVPFLLARLRDEVDDGLRVAYASALGAVSSPVALPELLTFLRDAPSEPARFELALAMTRIGGNENEMVRLWRRLRADRETALAQAVDTIRRQIVRLYRDRRDITDLAKQCSSAFDDNDLARGVSLLVQLIAKLPLETFPAASQLILNEVQQQLQQHGTQRIECLLLAIDTLDQALDELVARKRTKN